MVGQGARGAVGTIGGFIPSGKPTSLGPIHINPPGASLTGPSSSNPMQAVGEYIGGGFHLDLTNATSPEDLLGPFTTYSVNAGEGPFQASVQLSVGASSNGKGIYNLSFSPPGFGLSAGADVSVYQTSTHGPVYEQPAYNPPQCVSVGCSLFP